MHAHSRLFVPAPAALNEELQAPASAVFAELEPTPVAAASLGQVYRGRLTAAYGGGEVAVKVQRPGVVEMIAMDVYILRFLAGALRQLRKLNTDLPSLVDDWATSLFKELDYTRCASLPRSPLFVYFVYF